MGDSQFTVLISAGSVVMSPLIPDIDDIFLFLSLYVSVCLLFLSTFGERFIIVLLIFSKNQVWFH